MSESALVVADMDLGLDRENDTPDGHYYWAGIRNAILAPIVDANRVIQEHLHKVILQGSCASNERSREAVREMVHLYAPYLTEADMYSADPVYAASRGAAEMAKRVWWTHKYTGHDGE
jgi:hypothetical protein